MDGMSVGELSSGRAGDKGSTLDLTLVAVDAEAYARLREQLTPEVVAARLGAPAAVRYEVPGLLALKWVLPGALDAGPWASMRAGVHWQKTAISALLSLRLTPVAAVERTPNSGGVRLAPSHHSDVGSTHECCE
jgi:hypothetical protein